MSEGLQVALLVILIIALYVVSSRWRPSDSAQRSLRTTFWIGLAAALLLVLTILYGLRNA